MFISILFAVLVTICIFFISFYGKKWNLIPFVSLSAGGLLTLTFLDFLPYSFSTGAHFTGLVILLGVLVQALFEIYIAKNLQFVDRYITGKSSQENHNHLDHSHVLSSLTACSITGCLIICSFFDGIRFFAGLGITSSVGFLTGIGVFFHLLSHGVIASVFSLQSGVKSRATFILSSLIVGFFILGAFLAQRISNWFEESYVQAFATGVLMYACFLHLIPLALKPKNRKWFLIGLVLFALPHIWY